MIFLQNLAEVDRYFSEVRKELTFMKPKCQISDIALRWLGFCLTGMIIVGALCWQKFERVSGGTWLAKALSRMFRHSPGIHWDYLLIASTKYLLKVFNIKEGHLVIDDLDRMRSKRTSKIWGAHKTYNKKGGGFINAQNIVMLVLVSNKVTMPVGFMFYRPDPDQKAWRNNDKKLKEQKIPKSMRPPQPDRNKKFPTKKKIAAKLLHKFKWYHSNITVKSIEADNAYLSAEMRLWCAQVYPKANFNSQLKKTQKVKVGKKREVSVDRYFSSSKLHKKTLNIRGKLTKVIEFTSARLHVKSLKRRMHVVAFRYEGENKLRYICSSQLTWRAEDIILSYGFRWLVEVVIEDWKLYDGWGQGACQYGIEGAHRGVQLSLLLDHFLLQHSSQRRLHREGKPLQTAGSLKNSLQLDSLYQTIRTILEFDNPQKKLDELMQTMRSLLFTRLSDKHMSGRELKKLEPSVALAKKFG